MNNFLQAVTNALWNSEPEGVNNIIDRAVENEVMAAELRKKLGVAVDDDFILDEVLERDLESDVFNANTDVFLEYVFNSYGNESILEKLIEEESLESILNKLNSDDVLRHYSSYMDITEYAEDNELINAVITQNLVGEIVDISGQFNVFDALSDVLDVQLFDWLITHNKVNGVVSELFTRFNNQSGSIRTLQDQALEQSNNDTSDSRFLLESITPASKSNVEVIQARLDQPLVDRSTEDYETVTIGDVNYREGCNCYSCAAHRELLEAASSQEAEAIETELSDLNEEYAEPADPATPQEIVETIRGAVPEGVVLIDTLNPVRNVAPERMGEFDRFSGLILQTWNI